LPVEPEQDPPKTRGNQKSRVPSERRRYLLDDYPSQALRPRNRSRSPHVSKEQGENSSGSRGVVRTHSQESDDVKPRKRAVSVPSSRIQEPDKQPSEIPVEEDFTNLEPAFYLTPDHSYARKAIELSFLVDLEEVLDPGNESPQDMIRQKLQEALLTSQAKRMKVEVRERLLTDEGKARASRS
jgi:hypothetical protein